MAATALRGPRLWAPIEHLNHLVAYYADGAERVAITIDDETTIYDRAPGDELACVSGRNVEVTIIGTPEYAHSLASVDHDGGKTMLIGRDPLVIVTIYGPRP